MNPILQGWTVPARPIEPRQPGAAVTQLWLCGEITVENIIPLFHAIRAARNDSIEIEIEIDSGGGNALCALGLYELLILHPHRVAATIIDRASSGAALVAMGADLRRVAPGAVLLLHETRASLEDTTAEVLRSILVDLDLVDGMGGRGDDVRRAQRHRGRPGA